jgi:hypothetical protein
MSAPTASSSSSLSPPASNPTSVSCEGCGTAGLIPGQTGITFTDQFTRFNHVVDVVTQMCFACASGRPYEEKRRALGLTLPRSTTVAPTGSVLVAGTVEAASSSSSSSSHAWMMPSSITDTNSGSGSSDLLGLWDPQFTLGQMTHPPRILILGKACSGKTVLRDALRDLIPNVQRKVLFTGLGDRASVAGWDEVHTEVRPSTSEGVLAAYDDILDLQSTDLDALLEAKRAPVIVCAQFLDDLAPATCDKFDIVLLAAESSKATRRLFFHQWMVAQKAKFPGAIPYCIAVHNIAEFDRLMDDNTDNYHCMVLVREPATLPGKVTRNGKQVARRMDLTWVARYKASLPPPPPSQQQSQL